MASGWSAGPAPTAPRHAFTAEEFIPPSDVPEQNLARVAESAWDALKSGALGAVKLSGIPGLLRDGAAGAVKDQADVIGGMLQSHYDQYRKAKDAEKAGRWSEMIGHSVAAALPGVGPLAASIGEKAGTGDIAGATGEAIGDVAIASAPKVIEVAPAVVKGGVDMAKSAANAVGGTVADVARNPAPTLIGAAEGYQMHGIPGAIAGAVGVPLTLRAARSFFENKAGAVDAEAVAAKAAKATDAMWEREAKNMNARDAFLAKQAATEAKDLAVHQRMAEKISKAQTAAEAKQARADWQDIIQHAKNLNAAEKFLAQKAAHEAETARAAQLANDTTAAAESPSMSKLMETIGPRIEANGLTDMASEARELSRKLVLSADEQQRLSFLMARLKKSAQEVGMTYPAAHGPGKK